MDENMHLPLIGIAHDNLPTLSVVLVNAHLFYIFWTLDAQHLVNFIFLQQKSTQSTIFFNKLLN